MVCVRQPIVFRWPVATAVESLLLRRIRMGPIVFLFAGDLLLKTDNSALDKEGSFRRRPTRPLLQGRSEGASRDFGGGWSWGG